MQLKKKYFLSLLVFIVIGIWVFLLTNKSQILNDLLINNYIEIKNYINNNLFSSILIYILIYIVLVSINFPFGSIISISGGFFFGIWIGVICITIGSTTGALIVFLISKYFLSDFVERKYLYKYPKLKENFKKNDLEFMFCLRMIPLIPYFVQNLLLSLLGTTTIKFYLTTIFGQIPWSFIFASIGQGLDDLTFKKIKLTELLLDKSYFVTFFFFIFVIFMLFRLKKNWQLKDQ